MSAVRKRYNLYYIFKDDYDNRKLSSDEIKKIKEKIFSKIFQKDKTEASSNSS